MHASENEMLNFVGVFTQNMQTGVSLARNQYYTQIETSCGYMDEEFD